MVLRLVPCNMFGTIVAILIGQGYLISFVCNLNETERIVRAVAEQFPSVVAVYLFGSRRFE